MRDIFTLVDDTLAVINRDYSYHRVYPFLLSYFSDVQEIGVAEVVCGSHMVYGWMPTILTIHCCNNEQALKDMAGILNQARKGVDIRSLNLRALAQCVNKSMVGASKLLHFAAPNHYPIWDSRVYRFVHESEPYSYRLNDLSVYLDYVDLVHSLTKDERTPKLTDCISDKLGYSVTPVRSVELVMFISGLKNTS